jgi:putative transposase
MLHKPRLLGDNGPCSIAGDLAEYLEENGMDHVHGAPIILRRRARSNAGTRPSRTVCRGFDPPDQTLILLILENYDLQGELEAAIAAFVEHDNNPRYHESLGNLAPAVVYFGRGLAIPAEREKIKKLTIQNRRLNHQRQTA